MTELNPALSQLASSLEGEFKMDDLHKHIYATDASVYRKIPLAVCFPKNSTDLKKIIAFANREKISLIPRTAGTSLAGQCVGDGIVVDVSKHFTKILEFDEINKTVTVEPGVIRDDLNRFLKPYGLFFGPNTSTSNRCMIGGMVGNNSSGTTSIKYGVTRDKIIALKTILSDGSEVTFKGLSKKEFHQKKSGQSLENKIYQTLYHLLEPNEVRDEIIKEFPKKSIHRRNNGYAIDELIDTDVFSDTPHQFNLAKLLCGSEGTLAFSTEIKLQLDDLPPKHSTMVAAHFTSIQESLKAVVVAMKHDLYMCELMDKTILDCTKNNREQSQNRFFLNGDPEAILMMEVLAESTEDSENLAHQLIKTLQDCGFGYAYPILQGSDIEKAYSLRKAGLGLLGNIVGDNKAVACIEDTAVEVSDLPDYIEEFTSMMDQYGQKAVYYAHAGAGELHLRPILNLKKSSDVSLFKTITTNVAQLVKKYNGSMSGEHGDGIVRSEFLKLMLGDKNYQILERIKQLFDPHYIFNRGKIIDPFPMNQNLRYQADRDEPQIDTLLDFSDSLGILRATEKCNGSGDCRKSVEAGGTMCPSYRATKDEKDTTRARANALREFLTHPKDHNKFNHSALKNVFDLCLSCKACAKECPSNVDVAALKAEFLHQYQSVNGIPLRSKLFAYNVKYNKLGMIMPKLTNAFLNTSLAKSVLGIAQERSIPKLANQTFENWLKKQLINNSPIPSKKAVYLFIDEFTNFYDVEIGKDLVYTLQKLGYHILITPHAESGRSAISKGMLDYAKILANKNVAYFKDIINEKTPLIGIEPSSILTFRDEYLRLADDKKAAQTIAKNTYTIEEFFNHEIKAQQIKVNQFTDKKAQIKIHGHCHQKALSQVSYTFNMLNLPQNFEVSIYNSGCCGMAGSFGYEKEHYSLSMQVGEDSIFKKVRHTNQEVIIAAAGTSCRHQILDGTKRIAYHPVSILKQVLK